MDTLPRKSTASIETIFTESVRPVIHSIPVTGNLGMVKDRVSYNIPVDEGRSQMFSDAMPESGLIRDITISAVSPADTVSEESHIVSLGDVPPAGGGEDTGSLEAQLAARSTISKKSPRNCSRV